MVTCRFFTQIYFFYKLVKQFETFNFPPIPDRVMFWFNLIIIPVVSNRHLLSLPSIPAGQYPLFLPSHKCRRWTNQTTFGSQRQGSRAVLDCLGSPSTPEVQAIRDSRCRLSAPTSPALRDSRCRLLVPTSPVLRETRCRPSVLAIPAFRAFRVVHSVPGAQVDNCIPNLMMRMILPSSQIKQRKLKTFRSWWDRKSVQKTLDIVFSSILKK